MKKLCPRCGQEKELNEDNFYPARPRKNHKKAGWQSFCRLCWKSVNAEQRERRKSLGTFYGTQDLKTAKEDVKKLGGTLFRVEGTQLIEVKERVN